MQCPNCQRDVVEGAAFCNHCGSRLEVRCGSCQALNPEGSSFCHRCGTAVGSTSGVTEGHTVTGDAGDRTSDSTGICPRCNSRGEPGSLYCFSCGLPFENVGTGSFDPVTPKLLAEMGTPAGFRVRLVAFLIDLVILFALSFFALSFLGDYSLSEQFSVGQLTWVDSLGVLVEGIYFTLMVALWRTTIGKRLFSLYVVRTNGSKVGVGRALIRYLAYFLSGIIFFLGFLLIAVHREKRGLHDLICDTQVIRR